MLTFSRPVEQRTLEELRRIGVQIAEIEVVTSPDADGLRWTFVGADEPAFWDRMAADAAAAGVQVLGITSAKATVPNAVTLDAVSGREDVFLFDASIEDYERANPAVRAAQNDLFWHLMGWE